MVMCVVLGILGILAGTVRHQHSRASRTASWHGRALSLSAREYAILTTLANNRGRILSRQQLEEALYGWTEEIESNAVEVHVHHLRRKTAREIIRTVRNIGYTID